MSKQRNPLKEYEFLYEALSDKRGLDITGIYLEELSSVADVFVLVTANSDV
ncbi:MAG: RsfS/YbeB/iojap family protein, partial [Synergistaceae bacterium]|nr:RsfS/YbeB/iojap family protein [Synergistaceae bacterium]